jgi:uncharacterized protein
VRAVLDANVLVSALLTGTGTPGQILARWFDGEYELVVSPHLLYDLARTLQSPKFRGRFDPDEPAAFVVLLRERATIAADPEVAPPRAPDPDDDYLLALAESERAVLVSGDQHLLGLAAKYPIFTPRDFLRTLESES